MDNNKDKPKQQIGINGKQPTPLLIGSEAEIWFKWNGGKPVLFQEVKITGDRNKDVFGVGIPTNLPGATMKFVHPDDPTQSFEIFAHKKGEIQKEIKKQERDSAMKVQPKENPDAF